MLGDGATDHQVCRELGLTPASFQQCLTRVAEFADTPVDPTRPIALCERALRSRADSKVRSLQARFQALMETAPEAVLVVDGRSGIIREANEQAARLFGRTVEALVGLSVEALVPEELQSIHQAYRLGFLASTRRREMGHHPGIVTVRPDGSKSDLAIALTTTNDHDDVMVVCTEYNQWLSVDPAAKVRAAGD